MPSWSWLINFTTGGTPTRSNTAHEQRLLCIERPLAEFCVHTTFRAAELGALLGYFAVYVPYYNLIGPYIEKPIRIQQVNRMQRNGFRYGWRTMWAFAAVAPLLTVVYCKARGLTQDQLWDRCFRLRLDQRQLMMDRLFASGAAIGFFWRRWQGVLVVTQFSIIYGFVYTVKLWDRLGFHILNTPTPALPEHYMNRPPALLDTLDRLRPNKGAELGETDEDASGVQL